MNTLTRIQLDAAHEAGHVVLSHHVGLLPIESASIEFLVRDGEEEGPGVVYCETPRTDWLYRASGTPGLAAPPERYALVLAQLLAALGGVVAERMVAGRFVPLWSGGGADDAKEAMTMARLLGVPPRRRRHFVRSSAREARRILVVRWPEVEDVARALAKHGTVPGPDLRAIIERARRRRAGPRGRR